MEAGHLTYLGDSSRYPSSASILSPSSSSVKNAFRKIARSFQIPESKTATSYLMAEPNLYLCERNFSSKARDLKVSAVHKYQAITRSFRALLGCTPNVILTLWDTLVAFDLIPEGGAMKNLLWTLKYAKNSMGSGRL
jgi:hypothetical protein